METIVNIQRDPKLNSPVLVGGLPGIGYVAKLSADYLVQQLNAELFAELYSQYFPPYVLVKKDGTVDLMKNEFYFWKSANIELIIFSGNCQAMSPEGQYQVADEVLKLAKKLGAKRIIALAAFATDKHVDKPKVFGAATNVELLEELKTQEVVPMGEGSISGINGLLFGLSKLYGLPGCCLLGETSVLGMSPGRSIVDARGAQAVLEVLTKSLNVSINMGPLQDQARSTEELLHKVEEMERQVLEEMAKKGIPPEKQLYI